MINTIDHIINIDLATKINMNQSINIKQNDNNSHKFVINIFNNSVIYNLTGTTSRIYFQKHDNTKVFLDCVLDEALTGNISCLLTTQVLSYSGLVGSEITIYGSTGEILTSVTFNFIVSNVIRDDAAIESTSEFTALTDALAVVATMPNKLDITEFTTFKDDTVTTLANKLDITEFTTFKDDTVATLDSNTQQLTEFKDDTVTSLDSNTQQLTEFKDGTNNPREFLISIIDDDGTTSFLTVLKPLLVARGLKCDCAVNIGYTDDGITPNKMTAAQLVQLELEGFGVLNHGWQHMSSSNLTLAEIEANSILEKDKFNALGLTNSHDYYVYPAVMDLGNLTVKNNLKKFYKCNFANTNASANTIPFDSMEIRRENLPLIESSLPIAKRYIDDCFIKKQYCVFLVHSGDVIDTTFIAELLDYIVSEGYTVTPSKTVIDNYKNIIELGNKSSQHFFLDQSGNMDFSSNAKNMIVDKGDYTLPITSYNMDCVTYTLVGYEAGRTVLPSVLSSTLITYRLSWLKYADDRYAYQLLRVHNESVVYIRIWLYATNVWSEWSYYNRDNNPGSIFDNTIKASMTDYKLNCVTHQSVVAGAVLDMPNNDSGTLDTYKYNIEKYTRQEFQQYNTNDKWVRKWIYASSSWTAWSKYTMV